MSERLFQKDGYVLIDSTYGDPVTVVPLDNNRACFFFQGHKWILADVLKGKEINDGEIRRGKNRPDSFKLMGFVQWKSSEIFFFNSEIAQFQVLDLVEGKDSVVPPTKYSNLNEFNSDIPNMYYVGGLSVMFDKYQKVWGIIYVKDLEIKWVYQWHPVEKTLAISLCPNVLSTISPKKNEFHVIQSTGELAIISKGYDSSERRISLYDIHTESMTRVIKLQTEIPVSYYGMDFPMVVQDENLFCLNDHDPHLEFVSCNIKSKELQITNYQTKALVDLKEKWGKLGVVAVDAGFGHALIASSPSNEKKITTIGVYDLKNNSLLFSKEVNGRVAPENIYRQPSGEWILVCDVKELAKVKAAKIRYSVLMLDVPKQKKLMYLLLVLKLAVLKASQKKFNDLFPSPQVRRDITRMLIG